MKKLDPASVARFENLDYEGFKLLAKDPSLSSYEKIGFPDHYRKGKEPLIWQDIKTKLTNLTQQKKLILDIGPGCSELPDFLLNEAVENNSKVIFCDSEEMLAYHPDHPHLEKVQGPFPDCWAQLCQYAGLADAILVYSVLHHIGNQSVIRQFLDRCLHLLACGGQLLIGDIPNHSKRVRFFSSPTGIEFHKKFTGRDELPNFSNKDEIKNKLDDSIVFSLIKHARDNGFDAYVVPQADELPMANRREDILIVRP